MLRISLIDDDVGFLEIIQRMLHDYLAEKTIPCKMDSFNNPELLYLEFLEKREYDICFLDIEMPQMDGHHLTKLIKEDPVLKKLPVILFSSLITEEMKIKGRQLGADAQIYKPEIASLVSIIDGFVLGQK